MNSIPKLHRWKSRDLAFVYADGGKRKIYLGKWNSPEARTAYLAIVNQVASDVPVIEKTHDPTVAEIVLAFFQARRDYYVKNGKQTGQLQRFKASVEFPLALYPDTPIRLFGPKRLIECRSAMERSGRFARSYINTLVNCFRQIVKHAVEVELCDSGVLVALQSVSPLKRGRSATYEVEPVLAVSAFDVDCTLKELSPVVADMVRLQRLTGMRPGEVCAMRVGDVASSADGSLMIYTLRTDKTDWRREAGNKKRIPLGPKAQAILFPYLVEKEGHPDEFVFTPEDAQIARAGILRRERKTAITKQTRRRDSKESRREYSPNYDSNSYRHAVQRAAERAGVAKWTPNQLRHLFATEIRAKYGLEASQLMLGHSNASVTQIYAERDFKKAVEIAKKEG